MYNKGKALTFILVFLTIISLLSAAAVLYFWDQEKSKTKTLQETVEELTTKQRVAVKQLDEAKKLAEQLDSQLQETKKQFESLADDLEKERKSRQEMTAEQEQLRVALKQKETSEQDLKTQLDVSQKKIKTLETQLKSLESEKTELEEKTRQQEQAKSQNVELGKIVIGQDVGKTSAPTIPVKEKQTRASSLEGKVLVVNREYSFAVINLGKQDGVNFEDVFSVYSRNKYLGDIKVEKVHDSMSAANFLSDQVKDRINEGDKVVFKSK